MVILIAAAFSLINVPFWLKTKDELDECIEPKIWGFVYNNKNDFESFK